MHRGSTFTVTLALLAILPGCAISECVKNSRPVVARCYDNWQETQMACGPMALEAKRSFVESTGGSHESPQVALVGDLCELGCRAAGERFAWVMVSKFVTRHVCSE